MRHYKYFDAMVWAMRRPSAAAAVIPPAYPQPSPQGYTPAMPSASKCSPRRMRTGELVRDSTPVRTPS